MAGFANKIQVILDVTAEKAVVSMRNFRTSVAEADGAVNKFKAGSSAAMATVKANAAAFAISGGAAMVAFGVKSVQAFQDTALAAGKFSDATGVGVEAASRWREVGSDIGVSGDVIEGAFNKMNKTLGATPEKFEQYGVAVSRAADGSTDVSETFLNVVDRLNAIADPAERARVASELLGKGWTGMAELIAQGSDGLRDSLASVGDAQVISPDEEAKAKRTRAAMDDLSDAIDGLMIEVGDAVSGLIPLATELAKAAGAAADLIGIATGGDAKSMSEPIDAFSKAVGDASTSSEGLLNAFGDLAVAAGDSRSSLDKTGEVLAGIFGKQRTEGKLDNYRKAFADLAAESPDQARRVFDALKVLNVEIATGNQDAKAWADQWGFTGSVLNDFEAILGGATTATTDNAAVVEESTAVVLDNRGAMEDLAAAYDVEAGAAAGAKVVADSLADSDKALADATTDATDALNDQVDALEELHDGLDEVRIAQRSAADTTTAVTDGTNDYLSYLKELPAALKEAKGDQLKINDIYAEGRDKAVGLADAVVANAEAQYASIGVTVSAADKLSIWNEALLTSAASASGPLRKAISGYIAEANDIPLDKVTEIVANVTPGTIDDANTALAEVSLAEPVAVEVDAAQAEIDAAKAKLDVLKDPLNTTVVIDTKGAEQALYNLRGQWLTLAQLIRSGTSRAASSTPQPSRDELPPGMQGSGFITREAPGVVQGNRYGSGFLDRNAAGGISHTSTPAATAAAAAAAAVPEVDPRDAIREQDDLQAAMFETSDIGLNTYRDYLKGRQEAETKWSAEWMQIHRQIARLNEDEAAEAKRVADEQAAEAKRVADAKQAETDLIQERENAAAIWMQEQADRTQKYLYDSGQITLDQYKAYLEGRRAKLAEYSEESIGLWGQIHGLEEDAERQRQKKTDDADAERKKKADEARAAEEQATKDHLDYVARLFEEFAARRDAAEANTAVTAALGEATEAQGRAGNRRLTADERADAERDRDAALKRAAESLFRRADASANAAGIADRTPEWAAAVTASLLADLGNSPALAPWLGPILSGIPSFATGGIMPGRPGQPGLAIVHGGEQISPPGQGGSNYFDFRGAIGVDGPAVERWLVTALKNHERKNGLQVYSRRAA